MQIKQLRQLVFLKNQKEKMPVANVTPPPTAKSLVNGTTAPAAVKESGSDPFLEAVKQRRTMYALKASSPIPDKKIVDIVRTAVEHVPTSFNSQTTRAVVLLHSNHTKFWDSVSAKLKGMLSETAWPATESRLQGFRRGYGTVLWFEDQMGIKKMQDQFPRYAAKYPFYASQSNGMSQFVVWAALEKEGLGANLQHYDPLVDQDVRDIWGIPEEWRLSAQLVFGTPTAPAGEKTFMPVDGERLRVFGLEDRGERL